MWLALVGALLILAIAQVDEQRRFRRVQDAYVQKLTMRAAQSAAYLDQIAELQRRPAETRGPMPMPPPLVAQRAPPEPRWETYTLIARIRQALCIGAFTVAAAMPTVWLMSTREFARRHRRMMAEAMLALALFATIGMLLGWGNLANWKRFRIGTDAAGYGLVLVPLGVIAILLASRDEVVSEDTGDTGGGGIGEGGSNT